MADPILVTLENHIATVLLNQPETGNALDVDTFKLLSDRLKDCENDKSIYVIVLTGAGKHFSTGGNIKGFLSNLESGRFLTAEEIETGAKVAAQLCALKKPTIAMVNNAAFGAGCSIACACDFRLVDSNSKFCMAFINMGLSGDTGSFYLLNSLVGFSRATDMMMTGRVVGGEEAERIGLATRCVESGHLEKETYRLAALLSEGPRFAYQRQKELANQFCRSSEGLLKYGRQEAEYMADCMRTNDFSEAVRAFLEKRKASFSGT